ncbi:M3 family metallopeptidase [Aquabacterium sp. A7-Y]|uniref:M3 family metallopeptidase n=1 Tax=Aquabacterium sp. A7-Y TaxID=1349605 RepID=UPI00223E7F09|nr:M3 family metallopeptidase [Aquabacterium sp. A7-Y]MCW7539424.1 M3 family metallopeptidase [Aquabacterium sp. A7-Y]
MSLDSSDNPLLHDWLAPYGLPPFGQVRAAHYAPAFAQAMQLHRAELDAIAANPEPPGFENTAAALDGSGRLLRRIELLFENLCEAHSDEALQVVEREMAPRLAAHRNAVYLHAGLFARLDAVHERRAALGLDTEAHSLLERLHRDFVLAGARLSPEGQARHAAITERLAALHTAFSQAVLGDENAWLLALQAPQDLDGLPPFVLDAARVAAAQRGLNGGYAITLSASLIEPFLAFSTRRDLRELAWRAWSSRGTAAPERDTRPLIVEILELRLELARLHGHASYADYALSDRMAATPQAAETLLMRAWEPARRRALEELEALQAQAGDLGPLQPWDWRFYAEQVRQQRFHVDDTEVKPYFQLDRLLDAMFDCAGRLFGLRFVEQPGPRLYHPDVRLWEVRDQQDERLVGLFLGDNFARPGKKGGAWMSLYRLPSGVRGEASEVLPIVANHNNFAKAPDGEPTLLSADDVRGLFHEFGHGLHGLLGRLRYERVAACNVLQDFIELPSQLFEHWGHAPDVLRRHALHARTGEPIPEALLARLEAARRFNQGYQAVQYVAPALIDLALHRRTDYQGLDVEAVEREWCERLGVPGAVGLRHRLPHFRHVFSGSHYAAGYYVYLWAEVLDADAWEAFVEAGDIFDPTVAARLHQHIYRSGGSVEPRAAYRAFRGRDARVEPMLAQRGLLPEAGVAAGL